MAGLRWVHGRKEPDTRRLACIRIDRRKTRNGTCKGGPSPHAPTAFPFQSTLDSSYFPSFSPSTPFDYERTVEVLRLLFKLSQVGAGIGVRALVLASGDWGGVEVGEIGNQTW